MNNQYKEVYFDKLYQLYPLYDQVRKAIILAENFNDERKMYIAPVNQLRSSLDHIFKALCNGHIDHHCDYELKEAREHLDRAGYDALELLSGNIGAKVIDTMKDYSKETIIQIFPDYYTQLKPKLTDIKQAVAILRSEKKIASEKSFSAYFEQIGVLLDIDKKIDSMVPSLSEYEEKKQREDTSVKVREREKEIDANIKARKKMLIGWGASFIIGLLVGVVLHFLK